MAEPLKDQFADELRDRLPGQKTRRIATASTRRHNSERHRVELQIGGTIAAEASFDLTESSTLQP